MITINLLPWRSMCRERAKKNLILGLMGSFGLAVLMVMSGHYSIEKSIENQSIRNQMLKSNMRVLDQKKELSAHMMQAKEGVQARLKILKRLASLGPLTVHLFDELIRITPLGIVITQIQRENQLVTVWGYAESHGSISELMRNIENDGWIRDPKLTEIKTGSGALKSMNNEFTLRFLMRASQPLRNSHES